MKRILSVVLTLVLLMAGCQEEEGGPVQQLAGPELISCDPADGAQDLYGDALTVKMTFDQMIKCPSDKQKLVSIDGAATVESVTADKEDLMIEVSGLEAGMTYTLIVPEGIVQGYRPSQKGSDEIRVTFSMKSVIQYVPSDPDSMKPLVNPNASKEARYVYNFLFEQSGKKTLSGVQSSHSHKNDFVDFIYGNVGKHPALAGYDFLFLHFSPTPSDWNWVQNYNDISAPRQHWAANGLVSYMWHWNVPDSKEAWDNGVKNYDFDGYAFYTKETSFDIREALKPGTWQNEFIMKDIEEVACYLQLLEDRNIPVLWRPLHEAAGNYDLYGPNGAWFWWGKHGAEPCKQLWRLLYDQLVNVYGLDNLIWVWTVDVVEGAEDQYLDWYPGDEYVDILGVDIYAPDTEAKTRQYQALTDMTGGEKIVAITECGNIPDPDKCMEAGNRWSWFMVWCTTDPNGNIALSSPDWSHNTLDHWKNVMSSPYVLNREDMPSFK
ncbi:MAG: Ig-like domain-containing protein [Bacteroidales bacterium]|nr:Ig-like domain-containing protein [Bacteroidales bacterium]